MRNLPNVAPQTRDRVLSVADELSYRANPMASRLAAGQSMSIGMIVPVLGTWYFGQVIAGVEAVLAEAGYDLVLVSCDSEDQRDRLLFGREGFAERLDGVVVADAGSFDEDDRLTEMDTALVVVGGMSNRVSTVSINNFAGASMATRHLLELGHQDIGLIWASEETSLPFAVPTERRAGFHDAMASYGLTVPDHREVSGHFTAEGGADAMVSLLSSDDPPSAVFAISDEMAIGALRVARERGLNVPGDVSIIGFDGHELSRFVGLTTVEQDPVDHGAVGARLLLDQMARPAEERRATAPQRICHDVELVCRETTGVVTPN